MNYKKLAISALMSLLIVILVVIGIFYTFILIGMATQSVYFRTILLAVTFLGVWIAITCNYYKSMKKKKGKIKLHNIEYSLHEEKDNTKLSNLESKCKWWHKKRMQDMVVNYFYCPNCGEESSHYEIEE